MEENLLLLVPFLRLLRLLQELQHDLESLVRLRGQVETLHPRHAPL